MSAMSRARRSVLGRGELLAGAALLAGCKASGQAHEPTPPPRHGEAYQVSDPVLPPCRIYETDALTVERTETAIHVTASRDSLQARLVSDGGNAAVACHELRAEVAAGAPVSVDVTSVEPSCAPNSVRILLDRVPLGRPTVVPVRGEGIRPTCRVGGPVLRVERVHVDGGEVLRIQPTSARVRLGVAGGSFTDVVDVTTRAGATLQIVIGPEPGSAACTSERASVTIADGDVPPLGGGPKLVSLPE